jgi:hypothetical protein
MGCRCKVIHYRAIVLCSTKIIKRSEPELGPAKIGRDHFFFRCDLALLSWVG